MSLSPNDEHLSQLQTAWTVVRCAHGERATQMRQGQERLLELYEGAARRYLLAALKDEDSADEIYQEFALRLVRGDFRSADPDKGRFRNYLKAVLYRMIVDHQRMRKRNGAPGPIVELLNIAAVDDSTAHEDTFTKGWRDELLSRAWRSLQQEQAATGKPFYTVLRFRVDHPDLRSPELAAGLSRELEREISAANVRVILHRSRERFGHLLLSHVSQSLGHSGHDALEQELIELRLLDYCRPALASRLSAQ